MTDDILAAIDQAVAEHESCPCGRPITAGCPSWYWCSETCQIAWTRHQRDPDIHLHPREIRERQEQRVLEGPYARLARERCAGLVVEAPEPATPVAGTPGWQPADAPTAAVCAYTRWCPCCRSKQTPVVVDDRDAPAEPAGYLLLHDRPTGQQCSVCASVWPGRPLVGLVEQLDRGVILGRQAIAVRLRLSDGFRSASRTFSRRQLEIWRAPALCVALEWEHLEEMLCDGVTDRQRQESTARYRRARSLPWDWRAAARISRPDGLVRVTDARGTS